MIIDYKVNGEFMKELLKSKKITYLGLACELGVEECMVYKWLNNRAKIGLKNALNLSNMFEMPLSDFLIFEYGENE